MGMMDEVKTKKKLKAADTWFRMAETAKNPEKQIEYYTKSLDSNPYNAEAWFRRGRIMEKMGRFNDAQRSFDHAIEIDPDYQGLIGKKADSFEPSTSSNKSQEFSDFTTAEEVYPEAEKDDEWVTENIESEEGDNGFTSPIGDESIFSGLGSEPEEERVHDTFSFGGATSDNEISEEKSFEAEQEVTFAAVSGVKEEEEEEEVVFSASTEKENIDTFVAPEPDIPPASDVQLQSTPVRKEEKKAIKRPEPERTYSENVAVPVSRGLESIRTMDIRIPLNETIRFWLVGIVAIIIAFKILEFI